MRDVSIRPYVYSSYCYIARYNWKLFSLDRCLFDADIIPNLVKYSPDTILVIVSNPGKCSCLCLPTPCSIKIGDTILTVVSLSDLNRFSKFVHWSKIHCKICSKMVVKNPTTPCVFCHTTSCNINVQKQATNDKLQGTVYLRCGGSVNYQIKKGLLLSLPVKSFLNRWIFGTVASKKVVVSCSLCAWPPHCKKTKKVHDTIHLLPVTVPNIHWLKKFTGWLSDKPFLLWLLTIHHTLNM